MTRILLVVVSMLCAGCAGNSTQPSHTPLGQPLELRPGASAVLDGGLTVAFNRVVSDSRCPRDALCLEFHAGDAVVAVSISQSGDGSVGRELHTNTAGSEVSYVAYSIKLLSLSPYPRSDRQIPPGDYVATLVVARKQLNAF